MVELPEVPAESALFAAGVASARRSTPTAAAAADDAVAV